MRLRVKETDLRIVNMWTRMPFRYGIATLTALPHLFARVTLDVDGRVTSGVAADGLAPKWFTKVPDASLEKEVWEMISVIQAACDHAETAGSVSSLFELWQLIYGAQEAWGKQQGYPPLLWHFGVTLVERAAIDAFCRAQEMTFAEAVRQNSLGIRLGDLHQDLSGREISELLPAKPSERIRARHTVGLTDPLTDKEIAHGERVDDGLPQSLESCIHRYGLTHFKIKLPDKSDKAIDRLRNAATLIESCCPDFAFTVDGNEFFKEVEAFREFWDALKADSTVRTFLEKGLLFVEQPWHRDVALSEAVATALSRWEERPPIIIDESDGEVQSLPRALECGYVGTSHKNCKGVFKGLANAALIAHCREREPRSRWQLSGEDLANVGPVALLQDLTVDAVLGLEHVERNGHHYFAGLSAMPESLQEAVLSRHGDLYHRHETKEAAFPTLTIQEGRIHLESLLKAPFGYGIDLDLSPFTPVKEWRFESLHLM